MLTHTHIPLLVVTSALGVRWESGSKFREFNKQKTRTTHRQETETGTMMPGEGTKGSDIYIAKVIREEMEIR